MRAAAAGSRGLTADDPGKYLPEGTTEIVSGGADAPELPRGRLSQRKSVFSVRGTFSTS